MKKNKSPYHDWKEALTDIKSNFIKEKAAKKTYYKEQENALRPFFKQAAAHLGISQDQLTSEIKAFEPKLKEVLPDRRLKASTYAKLIKKYNPAYYNLFENKINAAVKSEQKYFQEKKEAILKAEEAMQVKVVATPEKKTKLGKYEKRAVKRQQRHQQQVKVLSVKQDVKMVYKPVSQRLTVEWHNVLFEDYMIKIKYGHNYSQGYPIAESRKSFIYLKKYIKTLQLSPLNILLEGREIREITNSDQVKEMVTLLRIREQLIKDFEQGKKMQAVSMIESIRPISKQVLIQLATAGDSEVQCIEYLAAQLAEGFKPIPAFEIIAYRSSVNTEDTFLFVIQRQQQLFLVWESTVQGRATYIFKTTMDSYVEVVQSIYDYIGSPRKAKRMALRKKDADTLNLGYDGYVTHSAFDHWQQKLEAVMLV